jgi:hypothetical protein
MSFALLLGSSSIKVIENFAVLCKEVAIPVWQDKKRRRIYPPAVA